MKIHSRLVLLAAILVLSATTLWAQTPAGNGSASISGRLTLDGKPLAGVPVVVLQNDSPTSIGGVPAAKMVSKGVSDDQGFYRFDGLAGAGYKVLPCNPAYVVSGSQNSPYGPGKYVSLGDGEAVGNIDFSLIRASVISGRVTLADGRPAVGAWISVNTDHGGMLYDPATGMPRQGDRTDDNGVFRIYGLGADKYKVSASIFAISQGPVFYPGVADRNSAGVVSVATGEEITADIKVGGVGNDGNVTAGQFVDENGKPVANVRFVIYPTSDSGRPVPGSAFSYGNSNSSGEFSVRNLSAGKHAMVLIPDDRSSYCTAEPVTFDPGSSEAARLRVQAHVGAAISGTAVIEGSSDPGVLSQLANLRVFASSYDETAPVPAGRSVTFSADGSFEAIGFLAGHLHLSLAQNKELNGFSLPRIERDGAPLKEGKLDIQDQERITGLRIVVGYGTGVIRGEVAGVDGAAIPGGTPVIVSVHSTSSDSPLLQRYSITDARGHFEIDGLPDGDYTIAAVYRPQNGRPSPPRKQTVTLAGGQAPEMKLAVDIKGQPQTQQ
ncbi:MAG TPA: carboxypeptidase-like regulatory domain-containing protein [Blastocatellia bacterium]